MKNFFEVLVVSIFLCSFIYAQQLPYNTGRYHVLDQNGEVNQDRLITVPAVNYSSSHSFGIATSNEEDIFTGTTIRWNYTDAVSIGDKCAVSGNGQYGAVGWGLNNPRISFYGNTNSTPIWEYSVANNLQTNFVSLNYAGDLIAAGAYHNVYVFNNSSNVPIINFDLTTLGGDPVAGPVALTQQGSFLIATSNLTDSSIILGFNIPSAIPVWQITLADPLGGSGNIQGLKLSGNDSLMIINTYGAFWVIETYTGNIKYQGTINPISSSSGTQANQGISYDGSIIATINYFGYVRVFQWSGSTYNLLWQNQEPPGVYYNWASAVDVSKNGNYIAVGTLIFISSTQYTGTVKLFKTSESGTPAWIFGSCGDEVTSVSFNDNANVLAASSWGDLNNATPDLYLFKTAEGSNPIFTINTAGSFFDEAISADGSSLLTSGKAVHARAFGNGGLAYNVSVDTSDSNIPVELVSLKASIDNNNVTLNWATATETNNKGFQVERKSLNTDYRQIAFVEGNGTTTQPHQYRLEDKNLNSGKYTYRLKQIDFNGKSDYSNEIEADVKSPADYSLLQNYPNPFNPSTTIKYSIPKKNYVSLIVYDLLGNEAAILVDEAKPAGNYEVEFDASNLSSGVYFYKLQAGSFMQTKKMIVLR